MSASVPRIGRASSDQRADTHTIVPCEADNDERPRRAALCAERHDSSADCVPVAVQQDPLRLLHRVVLLHLPLLPLLRLPLDLPLVSGPPSYQPPVLVVEAEETFLSLAESQLALAALASLCAGERDAIEMLRRLLRRGAAEGITQGLNPVRRLGAALKRRPVSSKQLLARHDLGRETGWIVDRGRPPPQQPPQHLNRVPL